MGKRSQRRAPTETSFSGSATICPGFNAGGSLLTEDCSVANVALQPQSSVQE